VAVLNDRLDLLRLKPKQPHRLAAYLPTANRGGPVKRKRFTNDACVGPFAIRLIDHGVFAFHRR
jgi:hypothetical protein